MNIRTAAPEAGDYVPITPEQRALLAQFDAAASSIRRAMTGAYTTTTSRDSARRSVAVGAQALLQLGAVL